MKIALRNRYAHVTFIGRMALLALLAGLACLAAAAGEPKAQQRPSPAELLRAEIVPDDAPVRPPYVSARYDLGLPRATAAKQSLTAMSRAGRGSAAAAAAALDVDPQRCGWQGRRRRPSGLTPGSSPTPLAKRTWPMRRPPRAAGPTAQLRLARLLLAECRFDEAMPLLSALADLPSKLGTGDVPRRALALLARHHAERAALEKHIPLLPLSYDLHGYLVRRGQDRAAKAFMARQLVAAHGQRLSVAMLSRQPLGLGAVQDRRAIPSLSCRSIRSCTARRCSSSALTSGFVRRWPRPLGPPCSSILYHLNFLGSGVIIPWFGTL